MSSNLCIAGIALVILGLIADVAAILLKAYNTTKQPYRGYAQARVVDIIPVARERYAQAEFRNRQAAVFEFFSDGKLIKIIGSEDIYPCPFRLHERVRLSYDPEHPEKYCIIKEEQRHYLPTALSAFGVLLILAGLLLFLKYALRFML